MPTYAIDARSFRKHAPAAVPTLPQMSAVAPQLLPETFDCLLHDLGVAMGNIDENDVGASVDGSAARSR